MTSAAEQRARRQLCVGLLRTDGRLDTTFSPALFASSSLLRPSLHHPCNCCLAPTQSRTPVSIGASKSREGAGRRQRQRPLALLQQQQRGDGTPPLSATEALAASSSGATSDRPGCLSYAPITLPSRSKFEMQPSGSSSQRLCAKVRPAGAALEAGPRLRHPAPKRVGRRPLPVPRVAPRQAGRSNRAKKRLALRPEPTCIPRACLL